MSFAYGLDEYTKVEDGMVFFRPTVSGSRRSPNEYVNGMTPADARKIAKRLAALADEAERPGYKPGRVYQSTWGNRYLRTADNQWISLAPGHAFTAGTTVADGVLSHPLTEVSV